MPIEQIPTPPYEAKKGTKEKILPETPRLRHLKHVFDILRSTEKDESDKDVSWRELASKVKPFSSGLELSDNVRDVVINFTRKKTPSLAKRIPSFKGLDESKMLEALAKNYFEELGDETIGTRREILLATATHIVKRIENHTYRKVLEQAPPETLEKLGLDEDTRDLLVDVLKTSIKADPLYIRFMAYSQLSAEPSEKSGPVSFSLPQSDTLHTLPELFPHETQFLSKQFNRIAKKNKKWITKPGGDVFKKYLETLAASYETRDPEKAEEMQKQVEACYEDLLNSDFPILITPATEGYYKEPYFDPELKISVATPDAKKEEHQWIEARRAMAESVHELNAEKFSEGLGKQSIRGVTVFGGFGVNITFNAVAQEKPSILIFVNEQIRAYDREFPEEVKTYVKNAESQFNTSKNEEDKNMLEKISRTDTVLHELSHSIYPDGSPESKRLGRKPLTILDEVKAEICYRPLIPSLIEKGGLEGTRETWAIGMLTSSIVIMRDQPKGDPYYYAAAYSLNTLFEKGAVATENNKIVIKDFDLYYIAQKEAAQKLLAVYRDPEMTERKASQWITASCTPNKKVEDAFAAIPKKEKDEEE